MILSVTMPTLPIAILAAIAENGSGVDLAVLTQYGVLGVITTILIWFARGAYQREKDRSDRAEAEKERLYTLMLERIIPALTSATKAAEDTTELLRALQRERELTNLVHPRRPLPQPRGDDA